VFASKHDLKNNPRLLYDITTMISPIELQRKGVKILRTDQKPGELILTFGGTYHAGFSHGITPPLIPGLNCSEAVNIAPTQWLAEHAKAVELYRRHGNCRKVSFPLEWLVIKILTKIDQTHFSQPHLEQVDSYHQYNRSEKDSEPSENKNYSSAKQSSNCTQTSCSTNLKTKKSAMTKTFAKSVPTTCSSATSSATSKHSS
jgi:hypothetical protein